MSKNVQSVRQVIKEALRKRQLDDLDEKRRIMDSEKEFKRIRNSIVKLIKKGAMRPACTNDYVEWLRGFLERGGHITHVLNYDMQKSEFYVAQKSFNIPNHVCGALSFQVIVPKGLKVEHGGFDHCEIYPLDYHKNPSFVPLYRNVASILLS